MQRTLKRLKEQGYTAEKVERWNSFAKRRQDLFGFGDILIIGHPPCIIQVCTMSSRAAHIKKILANENAKEWLARYNLIEVWSWRKLKVKKKDGTIGKKETWEVDVTRL